MYGIAVVWCSWCIFMTKNSFLILQYNQAFLCCSQKVTESLSSSKRPIFRPCANALHSNLIVLQTDVLNDVVLLAHTLVISLINWCTWDCCSEIHDVLSNAVICWRCSTLSYPLSGSFLHPSGGNNPNFRTTPPASTPDNHLIPQRVCSMLLMFMLTLVQC